MDLLKLYSEFLVSQCRSFAYNKVVKFVRINWEQRAILVPQGANVAVAEHDVESEFLHCLTFILTGNPAYVHASSAASRSS